MEPYTGEPLYRRECPVWGNKVRCYVYAQVDSLVSTLIKCLRFKSDTGSRDSSIPKGYKDLQNYRWILFDITFIRMAQIIVAGLAEDQKIHLCRSRPAEGPLKAGEYPHKNKSGETIAYRKNLATEQNGQPKPIEGVKLNRIIAKEWDNPKGKSWSFSLVVSDGNGSHRIDMGGGMLATNAVNSFLSLLDKTKEDIAEMTFSISFYHNKTTGFNSVSIKDNNGERLNWRLSNEEAKSYIRSAPNSLDPNKIDTDKTDLMRHYVELVNFLNPLLPRSTGSTGSALDGIDDDIEPVSFADADDVFDSATPAPAPAPAQSIPFDV